MSQKMRKLFELLENHPDLADQFIEALETKRFFITISYMKIKDPQHPENDLQHFWKRHQFDKADVLNSLKHIAADSTAKDNPNAEMTDDGNWH